MSWGWKIFIVFTAFVGFILFMVFSAVNQEFYLVSDNYYEKEIQYQGEIDMIRNARALKDQVKIMYDPNVQNITFIFPEEHKTAVSGNIYFFRPSDSAADQVFTIDADDTGTQSISVKSLRKGLWQVKVNWTFGATGYQEKKNITLQ